MFPFRLCLLSLAVAGLVGDMKAAERPNILFAIADDASFPHMSAYGTEWVNTPAFDRVAREGLLFTRAYTPNAKCAPSRSCILTGRNSWQLKEAANHWPHFPQEFSGFVEVLGRHGYATGSTGKGWAPGIAVDAEGKPREMVGRRFASNQSAPPTKGMSHNDYAANFEDFIDTLPVEEPWCFWYGASEPHRGYEFQSGVNKGGKSLDDIKDVPEFWPDTEVVRHDMLDYAMEIEHFDSHLERMLKLLDARGMLRNTLVVVTSDNGMPFPRIKGQTYELSHHLPLAIMWPEGINAPGRTIGDYVSFIDFAPTFLEVARVDWEESEMAPTTGTSLTDIFQSAQTGVVNPERDHVLIGKERHDVGRPDDQGYPVRGIIRDGMLYLQNHDPLRWPAGNPETGYLNTDGSPTKSLILQRNRDGRDEGHWQLCFGLRPDEEMYAVEADRVCLENLADRPAYRKQKLALRNELHAALRAQQDPRVTGNGAIFDAYEYADKSTRGFYERMMAGEKLKAGWVEPSDFEPIDR